MSEGASRTVLICDDDAQVRGLASHLFTQDGWRVVAEVENAIAAVGLTQALQPDVVVLDVGLVGLSGLDVIPELVAAGSTVVVCSSFGSTSDAAKRAGASAIVDKAELPSLLDVVNALPRRRRESEMKDQTEVERTPA